MLVKALHARENDGKYRFHGCRYRSQRHVSPRPMNNQVSAYAGKGNQPMELVGAGAGGGNMTGEAKPLLSGQGGTSMDGRREKLGSRSPGFETSERPTRPGRELHVLERG